MSIKKKMASVEFFQKLIIVVIPVILGGIALWTWQRKYWEYQLQRQTEDWTLRQCYSRRDSQRMAMEQLLIEINHEIENLMGAAFVVASCYCRCEENRQSSGGYSKWWTEQLEKDTHAFNDKEGDWLVQSQVIKGKMTLYFGEEHEDFEKYWDEIADLSNGICSLFRGPADTVFQKIWDRIVKIRRVKNSLLTMMQKEIDRFVSQELEAYTKKKS